MSVAEPGTDLVSALLLAQGGLIALGLILIDEVDNAYGDVYSGVGVRPQPAAALERTPLGHGARAAHARDWRWCCRCIASNRSC